MTQYFVNNVSQLYLFKELIFHVHTYVVAQYSALKFTFSLSTIQPFLKYLLEYPSPQGKQPVLFCNLSIKLAETIIHLHS